jgi:AbrB family looped-hinge helix DNA binding protein
MDMADEQCCDDDGGPRSDDGRRFFVEAVATMDERGQMVLPKVIRERAGLKAGDKLAISVMERDGRVCCLTLIKSEELAEMVRDTLGPVIKDIL